MNHLRPGFRSGGRHAFPRLACIVAAAAFSAMSGCMTGDDLAGTTDETNTARIVGPGGSSAPGAVVQVYRIGDTTRVPVLTAIADEQGRYSLQGIPPGEYNLIANSGDLALYLDTVPLRPGISRSDTLGQPGAYRGRVELQPGHNPRTVTVQALGTNLWSNVDSAGNFSFPKIPGGEYTLRLVTTLPDYTPTFSSVRALDDSAVVESAPIELIYTGKPIVRGLLATYDTVAGVVRLQWRRDPNMMDYVIYRDAYGAAEMSTTPFATVSDTSWSDLVFKVGGGWDQRMQSPVDEPAAALSGHLDMLYRVCGRTLEADGRCAALVARAPVPYEARRSGMRWTKMAQTGPEPGVSTGSSVSASHENVLAALGDALWFFRAVDRADGTRRISAWKFTQAAGWSKVSDSLPIGGFYQNQAPQVWNDTLWALCAENDTLRLVASEDGQVWVSVALPRTYLVSAMWRVTPMLYPTASGLGLGFHHGDFTPTPFAGGIRTRSGDWDRTDSMSLNSYDFPSAPSYGNIQIEPSGVYDFRWNIMNGSRFWRRASNPDVPSLPFPVRAGRDQVVELDGLLYAPDESVPAIGQLYATSVEALGKWWYVAFPADRAAALAAWNGNLAALAEDGSLWLGEPADTP